MLVHHIHVCVCMCVYVYVILCEKCVMTVCQVRFKFWFSFATHKDPYAVTGWITPVFLFNFCRVCVCVCVSGTVCHSFINIRVYMIILQYIFIQIFFLFEHICECVVAFGLSSCFVQSSGEEYTHFVVVFLYYLLLLFNYVIFYKFFCTCVMHIYGETTYIYEEFCYTHTQSNSKK